MAKRKLGEVLLQNQHVSCSALDAAMEAQKNGAGRLGEVLLAQGLVGRQELAAALEEITGVAYLDAAEVTVQAEALQLVPRELAQRHCVLPVRIEGKRLLIIMAEPQDLLALDDLRFAAGMHLDTRFAFRQELTRAIAHHYGGARSTDTVSRVVAELGGAAIDLLNPAGASRQADRAADAELHAEDTPAVKLVSAIIGAAVRRHASDIHFEQEAHGIEVRVRVDGVLQKLAELPAGLRHSIVSRIKILADLDISEKRVSQDGSFLVRLDQESYDLRISTLPTQHGEKVVIRILQASGPSAELRDLGMSAALAASVAELLKQPQGMLLVTGPTGSGKTTTLYAALKMLRERKLNITTVEDPIEYVLDGVTQVQVNTKAGRTFASALRSILRQDPNVILIGEIRDQETAEIAVQAAQTGHLVLSTLHTNDSFGAIGRLLDLGISRFLLSHSVSAAMGQRLVRKLCPCAIQTPVTEDYRRLARMDPARDRDTQEPPALSTAAGCEACSGTGYKGRIAVYELLPFTHAVRDAITYEAGNDELRAIAAADGMKTLFQQALALVDSGVTTVEELLRVIPLLNEERVICKECRRGLAAAFRFCPHCGARCAQRAGLREPSLDMSLR